MCRVAVHDAFDLYGRPEAWTWDPLDPNSLMFGYPVGPMRDVCRKFLSRTLAVLNRSLPESFLRPRTSGENGSSR